MRCPRCKYRHSMYDFETGKLMPEKMDVCVMCAYPITATDDEKFVIYACDKAIEYIAKYKETENEEDLKISEAYLKVAMIETQEYLPIRAEVSG